MNIADLYSTRIQKTFDEDQAEIVSILKANPKKSLKLITYYKGLPLSYPATVTSIDRGAVDIEVKEEQAFTIEQSRSAFIRLRRIVCRARPRQTKKGWQQRVQVTSTLRPENGSL